jgi:prepilin-type N-terminal cleavage/methylation domain-containing protein
MRKQGGFSLIELLIVVTIILIIAAIAIPNFLRSRMSANEASAVGSLRTINTAEAMYQQSNPTVGYTDLATLGSATANNLLDSTLGQASPTKSGYAFTLTLGSDTPVSTYVIGTAPISSSTGTRQFCSDQSFAIHVAGTTFSSTVPTTCAATLATLQ